MRYEQLFTLTLSLSLPRNERMQQLYMHFAPECMVMLLAVIFIASLTSALAGLILWRCFGAAGRWLGEDQSCKRATAAQKVPFSAPKPIPPNAEERPCTRVLTWTSI